MEKLIIKDGQGAVNSKGEVIIPSQYDFIETLKSGVYVAYSHNTGYHFYTDQGKLKLNDYVDYYHTDNDGNLIAVKLKDNMWKFIKINSFHEIDYIENMPNSISMVGSQIGDTILFTTSYGWKHAYSLKEKKVIFSSKYDFEITPKGYIVKNKAGKLGFINLKKEVILDYKWDRIELYSNCIKVTIDADDIRKHRNGIFSYTGECILGCKRLINVYDMYIYDKKKTLFKVLEITEEGPKYSILDYDTSTIFVTNNEISWIWEKHGIFEVKKESGKTIYRFDILNNEIRAVPIFIADEVKVGTLYGLYGVYFVKRNGKYGLYNQYGSELIPVKYKTIDEIVKMVK